jgi:hypothetical protein
MNPRTLKEMMHAVSGSMQERTGRTVEQWVTLVQASGIDPLDQNEVRRWLKSEHGVLQNSRYAIAAAAAAAAGWQAPTPDEYIDSQYTGPRASLRPVFDALCSLLLSFGDDVRLEGRATYIPFVRARQFAAVAAATASRIDVGLRFTNAPDSPLLSPAKAPGQATHKLSLRARSDLTPQVEQLLRTGYEQNG